MDFYTVTIVTPRKERIVIKHCTKDDAGNYYFPYMYRCGESERPPIDDMDEQIGLDYKKLEIPSNFKFEKAELETKYE